MKINNGAIATNNNSVSLNLIYNSAVDKFRFSLVSENDLLTNPANNWENATSSWLTTLPGSDGVKTVWVQFMDTDPEPDVLSLVQVDEIFYDTTPPAVSSFVINKNAVYVNSTAVTLYNNVSDLTPLQMRFQNGMAAGGTWEPYTTTRTWTLADTIGTRAVTAEFKDSAGNSTTVRDYIIYSSPVVTAASLGSAAIGTVTVSFNGGVEDNGTDVFYVYRRDYPSGDRYTELGNGTSSSAVNVSVTQGNFYYFHVRIYSALAGGYGSYSSTYALGYTANIAIIYDSADTTDAQTANDLKTILTTDLPNHPTYGSEIDGTMPSWSVILIPQSMVSTTYSASNVFHGDPVIITSGSDLYANTNQTRNVIDHGHGVVAMGAGGAKLLDTCETNWSAWGYATTAPTEIGWGESWTSTASLFMYTWTTGNTVWRSPLTSTLFPGGTNPTHDARTPVSYTHLTLPTIYSV